MSIDAVNNEAVLVYDEEDTFLSGLTVLLYGNGIKRVFAIRDGSRIAAFMAGTPVSVVVFGLSSAPADKVTLKEILLSHPDTRVIVVSTIADRETAVECMQLGASNYLVQPCDSGQLLKNIQNCLENIGGVARNTHVRVRPQQMAADMLNVFSSIVTRDRKMLTIFRYVEAIAPTSQAVMVTGETGTGKELIAHALHAASGRSGEFVSVNVAGLDDIMFSDTLFGHTRGAFTGADRDRMGLIEKAAGGTLFLDEIGDLGIVSQVKLLRLLQENEFYPLGSDKKIVSTTRFIVATNSSLDDKLKSGSFRADLYYRLCSHHIHLPALRERLHDIPLLVEHFSRESATELERAIPSLTSDTLDMLLRCEFPGNVRELKGMVNNAVAVCRSGILDFPRLKPRSILPQSVSTHADCSVLPRPAGRLPTLKEAEDFLIRETLRVTGGNQRTAAAMLGISRQALNKRLQRETQYEGKKTDSDNRSKV